MRVIEANRPDERPAGAFRWNLGGWLGGQLGGTLWLLILSVLVGISDPLTGAGIFLCFAVPNVYGTSLWKRRARLRPYPSMQKLVVVEGLCALAAVVVLHLRDAMRILPEQSQVSIRTMYGALLVFPVLLLVLHLQERAARRAQGMS